MLPFLKTLGIIDEEGKTGERARQWRDDARYPAVCKEIREQVYPPELLHAVTGKNERAQAESWFANKTGAGAGAVARMAVLYMLLLEADASKQPEAKTDRTPLEKKRKEKAVGRAESKHDHAQPAPFAPEPEARHRVTAMTPPHPQFGGVNINLEIHISADATPDQIDAIFAGMARHIYKNG